jgi:hypothetical protein
MGKLDESTDALGRLTSQLAKGRVEQYLDRSS